MYSILVNPTQAVTGALAPSSPLCGFIFSFSCDLIFFSFSLFLTPLWLCVGDRPVYLIDFAPPMPRFHRSPWAHTPIFSACSVAVPLLLSFLPRPPRSGCLHLVSSTRRCAPRERPHSRPPISTCGIALIFLCRKQKDQGPCRSGTAGQRGEGLGISYPVLAPSLSLFSLSFSNSLNFDAAYNAQSLFGRC